MEQPKKKAENRKRVHEEKARLAHLSAFQVPLLDKAFFVSYLEARQNMSITL